jgi:hypothetical protein
LQHDLKACQRGAAWLDRVCSALTKQVSLFVSVNVGVHAVWPAVASRQLRFLGELDAAGGGAVQSLAHVLDGRHGRLAHRGMATAFITVCAWAAPNRVAHKRARRVRGVDVVAQDA